MQRGSRNTKSLSKYAINVEFRKGHCINMKESPKVEIKDKILLTVEEAAAYSNIGINKIRNIINEPSCSFVVYIGKRNRLIKRKEFERYLEKVIQV